MVFTYVRLFTFMNIAPFTTNILEISSPTYKTKRFYHFSYEF
jgi:hypothetical protein